MARCRWRTTILLLTTLLQRSRYSGATAISLSFRRALHNQRHLGHRHSLPLSSMLRKHPMTHARRLFDSNSHAEFRDPEVASSSPRIRGKYERFESRLRRRSLLLPLDRRKSGPLLSRLRRQEWNSHSSLSAWSRIVVLQQILLKVFSLSITLLPEHPRRASPLPTARQKDCVQRQRKPHTCGTSAPQLQHPR